MRKTFNVTVATRNLQAEIRTKFFYGTIKDQWKKAAPMN